MVVELAAWASESLLDGRSPFELLEPVQYQDLRSRGAGLRRQRSVDHADESSIRQQVVGSWRTRSVDQESSWYRNRVSNHKTRVRRHGHRLQFPGRRKVERSTVV